MNLGRLSARMFDEVIIRQDRNLRGRSDDDIIALLISGIREVAPDMKVTVMKKEEEAIRHAIGTAPRAPSWCSAATWCPMPWSSS